MPINIPPYWAKCELREGKESAIATGWSSHSAAEALENAQNRARKVLDRIIEMNKLSADDRFATAAKRNQYDYAALPIREEILERITHEGREIAVISRNRYGAAVLNTEKVLFADVDFKPFSPGGLLNALAFAFAPRKKKEIIARDEQEEIARVLAWGAAHRDHPFRLYRTYAGLRLLFTGKTYDPKADSTMMLLDSLGSDPLYIKLTKNQSCFRARLTPKPWRIMVARPGGAYPFLTEKEAEKYRQWLEKYLERSQRYRCCELLNEGPYLPSDAEIRKVIEVHDRMGRVGGPLPLA